MTETTTNQMLMRRWTTTVGDEFAPAVGIITAVVDQPGWDDARKIREIREVLDGIRAIAAQRLEKKKEEARA